MLFDKLLNHLCFKQTLWKSLEIDLTGKVAYLKICTGKTESGNPVFLQWQLYCLNKRLAVTSVDIFISLSPVIFPVV